MLRRLTLLAGLLVLPSLPAAADETAGKLAAAHLEAGTLADGDTALSAILARDPANDDARFGLGMIRFVSAVEHLSQGLYRYGLRPPQSVMMPIVRLPVPENPNPEPIDYAKFRALVLTFDADLVGAEKTLAGMGKNEVEITLDLAKVRYDADGDGTVGEDEKLIAVIARIFGINTADMQQSPIVIAFDRGDAAWLRGYSNVLLAFTEFLLAYDWHESFDDSFHLFFPRVESPFSAVLARGNGDSMSDWASPFADVISYLHIRWPLAEPARMAAVREHLKTVTATSRESWAFIDAETGDNHEWLPNPRQTPPFDMPKISATQLAAWQGVLDEVDLLLDGKKLLPHWRLTKGINLRRVFEEPQPFDLVLWITGPAALPYLEDGPMTGTDEWNRITAAFEGSFGSYAIWFN